MFFRILYLWKERILKSMAPWRCEKVKLISQGNQKIWSFLSNILLQTPIVQKVLLSLLIYGIRLSYEEIYVTAVLLIDWSVEQGMEYCCLRLEVKWAAQMLFAHVPKYTSIPGLIPWIYGNCTEASRREYYSHLTGFSNYLNQQILQITYCHALRD